MNSSTSYSFDNPISKHKELVLMDRVNLGELLLALQIFNFLIIVISVTFSTLISVNVAALIAI